MTSTLVAKLPVPTPWEAGRPQPDQQGESGRALVPVGPPRPTPEVVAKATRRRFPAEYKQRILAEADTAKATPGATGALLRREVWKRRSQSGEYSPEHQW